MSLVLLIAAAGLKALRLLKLTDLEHLQRNDLMDFLYSMGMV
jgi:hypothetical protein